MSASGPLNKLIPLDSPIIERDFRLIKIIKPARRKIMVISDLIKAFDVEVERTQTFLNANHLAKLQPDLFI